MKMQKAENGLNNLITIKKEMESGKNIFEIPLRVCFYARVSTDKDEQKSSLKSQYCILKRSNNRWLSCSFPDIFNA